MIKPKKYLGQHFLKDENIAKKIANSLNNENLLPVLEIGPGTGILTKELLNLYKNLTLIEIDKESVEFLENNFSNDFKLIQGDFLKLNLSEIFNSEFCIIGNFPYNISSQIFFKMLDNREFIPELCGMIQKEVAERIVSKHGNKTYGILSVFIQLYYKVELLFTVNENVFLPPPKVKSAVIRMTRYRKTIGNVDEKKLFLVVKTAFNQRRKTMRNSLSSILKKETDTTNEIFNKRPEQLSPEDFIILTDLIDN
ncbi:MAG: 16S rRNA (adenine(1518)-N(6)/adenine(1519)-N(6))-dimethyltransferase RsmA [Bacteroidales bacterium]|jgi:16S rRNA (adenine1518-N6/adenine1519-N6)-dimethyltransferase|nr:16S rRNA (adenine(1518)-N(6)/adenine(1519)-N(6))-dimethyltransferase RsmA [Bacteroidales bacterium]